MAIADWSATAADNDDSDADEGINLAEGMAPGGLNDSARAIMAEIKQWYDSFSVPGITSTGDLTVSGAGSVVLSTLGSVELYSGSGPYIDFKNGSGDDFDCRISQSGANQLTVVASDGIQFTGAVHPSADNTYSSGTAAKRWATVYAGTGTINTSDATLKTAVALSDAVLRAVYRVPLKAFKFNDAIAAKGEANARTHYGYFAQDVQAALIAEGIAPATQAFWCEDTLGDGTTRQGLRYEEFATVRQEAERRVAAGTLTI